MNMYHKETSTTVLGAYTAMWLSRSVLILIQIISNTKHVALCLLLRKNQFCECQNCGCAPGNCCFSPLSKSLNIFLSEERDVFHETIECGQKISGTNINF